MLKNKHENFFSALAISFTVVLSGLVFAAEPGHTRRAATPPMGWNSWDCYGTTVREEEVKANADYMATHLAHFGWQYIVVDINQDSSGNRQSYAQGNTIAWTADAPGKRDEYVAVFNTGDALKEVHLSWADVGVKTTNAALRDLWAEKNIGTAARFQASLPPHASILYKVSPR